MKNLIPDRLASLLLRIRMHGIKKLTASRYARFKKYWIVKNYMFGRLVELLGNQVNIHGIKISVDNPRLSTHQKSIMLFGWYEKDEVTAINKYLRPDLPVIELGGGIGLLSCVINKKLDKPENHIVLEADPEL